MTNIHLQDCFILYLEDNPSNRKVMSLMLDKVVGIKTYIIFENSEDFTGKLESLIFIPTIFMLDIHVAPYNGFEVLKMIRINHKYASSKIIAVTASVMTEEVDKLRAAGFNGAISKPIDLVAFPKILQRIIDSGDSVWQIF